VLLASAAACVLGVAVAVSAWALGRTTLPDELENPAPIESIDLEYEDFDDARTVDLSATMQPSPGLVSRTSGLLTASACAPGADLASGQAAFLVDRLPVIALATAQPLTRHLVVGDRGTDVREIQEALIALGFEGPADGVIGPQTLRFFNGLRRAAVADAPLVDTIDPASVVWLPSTTVTATDCPTAVGSSVEPGTVLAALPDDLIALRVGTLPSALPTAPRTLTIDGVTAAVDGAGGVDEEAWGDIAATSTFRAYVVAPDDVVLSGTLSLRDPVRVARIPPSLLRETADGRVCVSDDGESFVGDLVSTDLGRTLVRFDDEPSSADVGRSATTDGGDPCG
jgi:peptidoglycan hydrolase-like protein with peptidoglycan-binding domain